MTPTNVQQNCEHSIALASHSHLQLHVSQLLHQLLKLTFIKQRLRTRSILRVAVSAFANHRAGILNIARTIRQQLLQARRLVLRRRRRRQRRDQLRRRLLFKVADVLFGSVEFACGALEHTQMSS